MSYIIADAKLSFMRWRKEAELAKRRRAVDAPADGRAGEPRLDDGDDGSGSGAPPRQAWGTTADGGDAADARADDAAARAAASPVRRGGRRRRAAKDGEGGGGGDDAGDYEARIGSDGGVCVCGASEYRAARRR